MELKEYVTIIKKEYKLIFTIGAIVAASAFLFSTMKPVVYETSISLAINKNNTQNTDDFKYDGYYALQASEMLANTIVEWIKSPTVVNTIYQKAEVNQDFRNIKSYTKKFTARKMSSQHVEVKFKTDTKENAEKISSAIVEIINNKTKTIEENSEKEIAFSVSGENPVIIKNESDTFLNLIIGFISGIVLCIFIVFGKRYFA
ncbi:MAG: Wzz/FepE/Etk N-terminal domain-containing protein [Patescibacteria group bacterium]|nr:Wzz/FepE/Etk N-terminal domain-containing protein [Patescibacteria group bacterium]